jgi:hypothetical protein
MEFSAGLIAVVRIRRRARRVFHKKITSVKPTTLKTASLNLKIAGGHL